MNVLGVTDVFLGVDDKLPVLRELLQKWNLAPEEVVYMGDDLPDLESLRHAGLAACPADSVPEVLGVSESRISQILSTVVKKLRQQLQVN